MVTAPHEGSRKVGVMEAAVDTPIVKMRTENLSVKYGTKLALEPVSLEVHANSVLALIGPSGCGKSTFLRSLNRMNETVEGAVVAGRAVLDGRDIYEAGVDPVLVRRRVGMVFQKSNPFPKSIFENVAFGLRIARVKNERHIEERVETALSQAALWNEVKDRLHESAL